MIKSKIEWCDSTWNPGCPSAALQAVNTFSIHSSGTQAPNRSAMEQTSRFGSSGENGTAFAADWAIIGAETGNRKDKVTPTPHGRNIRRAAP